MNNPFQISATISEATRNKLDRFTESHGLKKNFVVEQALLFFIEARQELPDEALIPVRITLGDKSFDQISDTLDKAPEPTQELKELMKPEWHSLIPHKPESLKA